VRHAALAVLMAAGTVYAATLIPPLAGVLRPTEARPPAEPPTSPPRTVSLPRAAVVVEEATSQEGEPKPEAETPPAAPSAAVREQPGRSPTPLPSAEQWKRAAQGLRDGDFQSADAALRELTRSGTDADRESALLVQAQVLLAQGREREAQSLLKSLEGSARAPSVRRKSAELLSRLRDRPAPRSGKARVVTEPP
jgi:outer membrane PBP1 activator LpoA protein